MTSSSDIEKLAASVEEYNSQLTEVSLSLQLPNLTLSDKEQLEELQQNLLQLLELTLDQLQHHQQNAAKTNSRPLPPDQENSPESGSKFDDEFALFQAEIASLESNMESSSSSSSHTKTGPTVKESEKHGLAQEYPNLPSDKYRISKQSQSPESLSTDHYINDSSSEDSKHSHEQQDTLPILDVNQLLLRNEGPFVKLWTRNEAAMLEGELVRAPYSQEWGGHSYHNAVVLSVEFDENCPMVTVLFSQPTSIPMIPCKFFLSESCRFSVSDCMYSHGYSACVTDLRLYREPSASLLTEGSRVLCLHKAPSSATGRTTLKGNSKSQHPSLWHPGTVDAVLGSRLSVECDVCCTVLECGAQEAVPIVEHCQDATGDDTKVATADIDQEVKESVAVDNESDVSNNGPLQASPSLFGAPNAGGAFGEWEKYTRGIGSALMQRMGYTAGAGLGRDGEGRVDPVPAYLYPAGVSLDRCMELRQRAGGEDMMQVEKRLKKEQEREERRIKRQEERLTKDNLFDIINNKLAGGATMAQKSSSSSEGRSSLHVGHRQLASDSNKTLNVKSYELCNQASQLEREIGRLEQSLERHSNNKSLTEQMSAQLGQRKVELRNVRAAERRVSGEQQNRRDAKKYVVF